MESCGNVSSATPRRIRQNQRFYLYVSVLGFDTRTVKLLTNSRIKFPAPVDVSVKKYSTTVHSIIHLPFSKSKQKTLKLLADISSAKSQYYLKKNLNRQIFLIYIEPLECQKLCLLLAYLFIKAFVHFYFHPSISKKQRKTTTYNMFPIYFTML